MFREKQQGRPGCTTDIATGLLLATDEWTVRQAAAGCEDSSRPPQTQACSDIATGNQRFLVFNKFEERIVKITKASSTRNYVQDGRRKAAAHL